jgi:hypothetical protein
MCLVRLLINRDNNQKMIELNKEHNDIMEVFNEINEKIFTIAIDRNNPETTEPELKDIGRKIGQLQERFLKWKGESKLFLANPFYHANSHDTRDIEFLHFMNVQFVTLRSMNSTMLMLTANFNVKYSELRQRRDYNNYKNDKSKSESRWRLSFGIATVGLIFSLLSPFFH